MHVNLKPSPLDRWWPLVLTAVLILTFWGSWRWILTNQVILGHDSTGYLETTVEMADRFSTVSLRNLFAAFAFDDYRPTLLFVAVQPFYQIFGVNQDSAQYINLLCLPLVIALTYQLGVTTAGRRAGLVAALLIAFLPMIAAMARLFYTEILLTVMVVLNLVALARSERFARRGWALVWGASLGFGLLTKWTIPMYIGLPLLALLWRGDVHRLHWLRFDGKKVLLALGGALILTTLWIWPSRQELHLYPLGNGLAVGWFLILALLLYCYLLPATPGSNFASALFLSIAIAGLWYLPHADFAVRLMVEDQVRASPGADPLSINNYLRNLGYLYHENFGPLAFWVIVPALLLPWIVRLATGRRLPSQTAILWWSLLGGFLALGLIGQSNPRNLVPLLPSIAVLAAVSLQLYPQRISALLGALWVLLVAWQWNLITFDTFYPFYTRTQALWTIPSYVAQPATGQLSPLYAFQDDLFATISHGQTQRQHLGMLIHTHQLHRGTLRFYIKANKVDISVVPLTEPEANGWYGMLAKTQWVLVKDGDNHELDPATTALVKRILNQDALFHLFYKEVKRYPLPNQESAYLYQRIVGPEPSVSSLARIERTRPIADEIRKRWSPQATLVYATIDDAYWVSPHDPAPGPVVVLTPDAAKTDSQLESLNGTLHVVLDHDQTRLEQWLDAHAYRAYATGDDDLSLIVYGRPTETLEAIPSEARWPQMSIAGLRSLRQARPGDVLPLAVRAEMTETNALKFSFRIVDADGEVIASNDRPVAGDDHLGLLIPPATAPGDYAVVALLYDEQDLTPKPTIAGEASALLFQLTIRE
jgi:hypothetical protein